MSLVVPDSSGKIILFFSFAAEDINGKRRLKFSYKKYMNFLREIATQFEENFMTSLVKRDMDKAIKFEGNRKVIAVVAFELFKEIFEGNKLRAEGACGRHHSHLFANKGKVDGHNDLRGFQTETVVQTQDDFYNLQWEKKSVRFDSPANDKQSYG